MQHFLVAESETADEREQRRNRAGKSAGETYAATLKQIRPNATITIVAPSDESARQLETSELRAFDAVFISGSPLHVYDDVPEVRRQIAFMRNVFASGTPAFGSCAGLQLAVAAAGGTVRAMPARMEAGIARGITATTAGRAHPLLAGRPASWDAPSIHGDEVAILPAGAIILATNAATAVQAAEIRYDGGVFWGVQYHPELALGEIAVALRGQSADLIDAGLAEAECDVEVRAAQLEALHDDPERQSLWWALGVDSQFADEKLRRTELVNFLSWIDTATDSRQGLRVVRAG